ncbi:MAG: glycoside hydrolase family 5 protein [Acetatifactor sp.]|nr:glycoside hydrolase family 5 protein [Acetatifactor sp.]
MRRRLSIVLGAIIALFSIIGGLTACGEKHDAKDQPATVEQAVEEPSVPAENTVEEEEQMPEEQMAEDGLKVDGAHLTDAEGNPIQLRGISTHGIAWFPDYVNREAFLWVKENAACNVVRISMYTSEWGGYCVQTGDKDSLKQLIDEGVQAATELGLYVIIDWHILGADSEDREDCNPLHYVEEAKSFFGEMSSKYKDYPNVIYEICNEPNNGEFGEEFAVTWQDIKDYSNQVIPVIRANTDNVIVVGTPRWSSDVNAAADDLDSEDSLSNQYSNIMYTYHFYAGSHRDWERSELEKALQKGLPVFVTEYASCDASGNGGIDETSMLAWYDLLDQYGVSYVKWNLSNKAETSAFINSSCGKVNDWSMDEISPSGQLMIREYEKRSR